jgi:hypothetical protein
MGRVFNVLPSLGCALVDRVQSVPSPLVQACVNIVGVFLIIKYLQGKGVVISNHYGFLVDEWER